MSEDGNTLIAHLEALRWALLRIAAAMILVFPLMYWASPHLVEWLTVWCFPDGRGLYYFSPMEAFWVQLKLALVMALMMAYPWNIFQIWRFVLPALYRKERRALGLWIFFSSVLFAGGIAFCIGLILPVLMKFSGGFATPELQPVLGLANFLNLAGWLMLAFGVMFQSPIAVLLAVRFGVISAETIRRKRPYVMTGILIAAAILTPPDIVSQVMLAVPTWLLFELGLILAGKMEERQNEQA